MTFLKVGHRQREGGLGDFISHIRQHYWPPDDLKYIPEYISKRTNFVCAAKTSVGRWEKHNARRKENLQHGFFSVPHQPYKPVGEVLLDPCDLVTKSLKENIKSKREEEFPVFKRQPYIFTPTRDTEKSRAPLAASATRDQASQQLQQEHRYQQQAGMREIRAALDESNRRIVVCHAGQHYKQHVQQCQERERRWREKEEAQGVVHMELQRLSSHMLQPLWDTSTPQPSHRTTSDASTRMELKTNLKAKRAVVSKISPRQLEEATAIKEAKIKRLTNRKLDALVKKLDNVYIVLASLHNMKTKHLRQKVPLSVNTVKGLRQDSSTDGQHNITDTRLGSVFMRGTRSHVPSSATLSGLDMLAPVDRGTGGLLDVSSSSKSKLLIPSTQSRDARRGSVIHRGSLAMGKSLLGSQNQSLNKSFKRKNRNVILQGQDGDMPRLETWEDLLNVAVSSQGRTRQSKQSRKLPPWQQLMVPEARSYQQSTPKSKQTDSKGSVNADNFEQDNMIHNWKEDVQDMKKQMQKAVIQELERLKRERITKFRYKLVTFLDLPPLFEHHQELLMAASDDAMKDPSFVQEVQEETVPWFDQLEQEIQSQGLKGEPGAVNCLLQLERFKYSEDIQHAKEKLCLLAMSLPISEICTQPMQEAIKFILSEVLDCKTPLLEKWLSNRKLYII